MENIANKTGFAGLVKKIAGVVGVVVVAGVAAGCVTTGEPTSTVRIPNVAPWEVKKIEDLGGCINIEPIVWKNGQVNKIAAKPNKTCTRVTTGGNNMTIKVLEEPNNGKLEVSSTGGSITWNYTPNKDFAGIDKIAIEAFNKFSDGKQGYKTIIIYYYVGDYEFGKNFTSN